MSKRKKQGQAERRLERAVEKALRAMEVRRAIVADALLTAEFKQRFADLISGSESIEGPQVTEQLRAHAVEALRRMRIDTTDVMIGVSYGRGSSVTFEAHLMPDADRRANEIATGRRAAA